MLDVIGSTAGRMWDFLGEKGDVSLAQLPRVMNEKASLVYQALGWLAKEGKVRYRSNKRSVFVSLSPQERRIYDSSACGVS